MSSMLCKNRPEGFGPSSRLYRHITTSCFNDVVLLPLSAWIYFILLIALFFNRPRNVSRYSKSERRQHRRCDICKDILYGAALFVTLAMTIVEVARLVLANLGVGLLPFVWPAFIIAGVLRFSHGMSGRFPEYWIAGVMLWLLIVVTGSVKIAEMVKEGAGTRKGTKYPMSDEIIDVGVYIGASLVLIFAEIWK